MLVIDGLLEETPASGDRCNLSLQRVRFASNLRNQPGVGSDMFTSSLNIECRLVNQTIVGLTLLFRCLFVCTLYLWKEQG